MRGAAGDRLREVGAHPHGQAGQPVARGGWRPAPRRTDAAARRPVECTSHPGDLEAVARARRGDQRVRLLRQGRRPSAARGRCSPARKQRGARPLARDLAGERRAQAGPIDGLNHIEQRDRVARLVRLQRSDQVQLEIGMRDAQGRPLGGGFLDAVFPRRRAGPRRSPPPVLRAGPSLRGRATRRHPRRRRGSAARTRLPRSTRRGSAARRATQGILGRRRVQRHAGPSLRFGGALTRVGCAIAPHRFEPRVVNSGERRKERPGLPDAGSAPQDSSRRQAATASRRDDASAPAPQVARERECSSAARSDRAPAWWTSDTNQDAVPSRRSRRRARTLAVRPAAGVGRALYRRRRSSRPRRRLPSPPGR